MQSFNLALQNEIAPSSGQGSSKRQSRKERREEKRKKTLSAEAEDRTLPVKMTFTAVQLGSGSLMLDEDSEEGRDKEGNGKEKQTVQRTVRNSKADITFMLTAFFRAARPVSMLRSIRTYQSCIERLRYGCSLHNRRKVHRTNP